MLYKVDEYQVVEEVLIAEQPEGGAEPEVDAINDIPPTFECSGCERNLTHTDVATISVLCRPCQGDRTLNEAGLDKNAKEIAELEAELKDMTSFSFEETESRYYLRIHKNAMVILIVFFP